MTGPRKLQHDRALKGTSFKTKAEHSTESVASESKKVLLTEVKGIHCIFIIAITLLSAILKVGEHIY